MSKFKFTVVAYKGSSDSPSVILPCTTFEEAFNHGVHAEHRYYSRVEMEVRAEGMDDIIYTMNMLGQYRPLHDDSRDLEQSYQDQIDEEQGP